jgi:hypothetical protein
MAGIGKFHFADLIPRSLRIGGGRGKPQANDRTIAEQTRELMESRRARNSGPSRRDRMVDIGRGNQQAGRQGD